MKPILCILAGIMLSGCAGIKTSISFASREESGKVITGNVQASLDKVQEFRSLLESLEYRVTEKPK